MDTVKEVFLVDGRPICARQILPCYDNGQWTLEITDQSGKHKLPVEFVGGVFKKHGDTNSYTGFQMWRTIGSDWNYPPISEAVRTGREVLPGVWVK